MLTSEVWVGEKCTLVPSTSVYLMKLVATIIAPTIDASWMLELLLSNLLMMKRTSKYSVLSNKRLTESLITFSFPSSTMEIKS